MLQSWLRCVRHLPSERAAPSGQGWTGVYLAMRGVIAAACRLRRLRQLPGYVLDLFAYVAVVAFFLSALVVGVLAHLWLPQSRRAATRITMEQVSRAIRGSIEIDEISELNLSGVVASGVTIRDSDGEAVLYAPTVRVRAELLEIGVSLLPWSERIVVPVTWARADRVHATLREDADGDLTLSTVFLAPERSLRESAAPSEAGLPLDVNLHMIEVGEVFAIGGFGGFSSIQARTGNVHGSVHVSNDSVTVQTQPISVDVGGILEPMLSGLLDFRFESPSSIQSTLTEVRVGGVKANGYARLDGGALQFRLVLPATDPEALKPFLPDP
ncbi:MAG: hypothetical protein FWD57_14400, partial [Polyangiaceae bacterium]|nr:hypothetical protein [Polyangiaceae bacterium]